MMWMIILAVFGGVIAVGRAWQLVRRARANHQDDWDERMVRDLRVAGGNAFTRYEVDFFFHLPDAGGCAAIGKLLEAEDFKVDSRAMTGEGTSGYSLHAMRVMQVSVSAMQEYSQRFRDLAVQHGGHYDGWSTSPARTMPSSPSGA